VFCYIRESESTFEQKHEATGELYVTIVLFLWTASIKNVDLPDLRSTPTPWLTLLLVQYQEQKPRSNFGISDEFFFPVTKTFFQKYKIFSCFATFRGDICHCKLEFEHKYSKII